MTLPIDVIRIVYSFVQDSDILWNELGLSYEELVHHYDVKDIKKFRKDFKLFKNLTSISCYDCDLPDDLDYSKIRCLNLETNERIKVLPETFKNLVSLRAYQSELKTVPSIMNHLEELLLDETSIDALPVMKKIKTLQISGTPIKKLNGSFDNLEVLRCDGCSIKKLPKGMKKLNVLSIAGTCVKKLPKGLKNLKELGCDPETKLSKKFKKIAEIYS